MRREHFLVADVYRHLAPFIDPQRPLYLSLDGVAARKGVDEGLFTDPNVPDLLCTLVDGTELALEMKILYAATIGAGRGQYDAWFNTGAGAHQPTGWVVADEKLEAFYYWPHAVMKTHRVGVPKQSEDRYVTIPVPVAMMQPFRSTATLALHVLRTTLAAAPKSPA